MINLKKYLADSILIVFSVLFALFINKVYDDHKTEQRKLIALESIQKELTRNNAILTEWKDAPYCYPRPDNSPRRKSE